MEANNTIDTDGLRPFLKVDKPLSGDIFSTDYNYFVPVGGSSTAHVRVIVRRLPVYKCNVKRKLPRTHNYGKSCDI